MKTELLLPSFLNTAIIYGDYSGFSDEEVTDLDTWLEENSREIGHCVDIRDDSEFYHTHDYYPMPLASDCCTYIFLK